MGVDFYCCLIAKVSNVGRSLANFCKIVHNELFKDSQITISM
jgi:hypothetical protein